VTAAIGAELAAHSFVRGLSAGHVEQLAALANSTEIAAGQRVFDEAEPATQLWLIRSGRIALDLRIPGRDRVIVETLGPGDELGLSWFAPVPRWQFGAVAQLPVSAFELSAAAVVTLCETNHELGYQLTRNLLSTAISRLQASRIRILDLYAPPAPASGRMP
jgi:CRP/FNR family transcriptional regulator, cyclic AMP receptor protein